MSTHLAYVVLSIDPHALCMLGKRYEQIDPQPAMSTISVNVSAARLQVKQVGKVYIDAL